MSTPQFFATPGYGSKALEALHYNQAVRIGDRVEISGQGGWDDDLTLPDSLEEEIRRAFDNVERTLNTAGASWSDVIHVNSYHVLGEGQTMAEHHNPVIVEEFRRRMPDHPPVWTQVGVTALGLPTMHIEIRVTAVAPQDS
jgi:enamine deaminase RidA (YjgF/YER057c/UK114 family)